MRVVKYLPTTTTVLLRGQTGIGKSEVVKQLAYEHYNLPLIDRRLSQMADGDLIGLPREGTITFNNKTLQCTRWQPGDWILEACLAPRVLHLDEINRATTELMQAAFQLCLDREIAGHKLHPQTVVFSSINPSGGKYQTNKMDPAFLNRFFVVDFDPDAQDWLEYAKKKRINKHVLEFFSDKLYHPLLRPTDTQKDVISTPRSWVRLADAMDEMLSNGVLTDSKDNMSLLNELCIGFIGKDSAATFLSFMKERLSDRYINAKLLLDGDKFTMTRALELDAPASIRLFKSISSLIGDEELEFSDLWKTNFKMFFVSLPKELQRSGWTELSREMKDKKTRVKEVHVLIKDILVNLNPSS